MVNRAEGRVVWTLLPRPDTSESLSYLYGPKGKPLNSFGILMQSLCESVRHATARLVLFTRWVSRGEQHQGISDISSRKIVIKKTLVIVSGIFVGALFVRVLFQLRIHDNPSPSAHRTMARRIQSLFGTGYRSGRSGR